MKTRKKLKLLQGITAIRVKAGITQLALAQYLGISKSLVSMVENGRRKFPLAALLKLSELELQFQQQQGSEIPFKLPAYTQSAAEASMRRLKESIKRNYLKQLQYRLKMMEELHEETLASLQYLHRMQKDTAGITFNILELEKRKLLKRLERCDETACATIKGKITMLEMGLESYHRENDITGKKQDPANKPGIGHRQKPGHPVAREIMVCNPFDPPGIEAAA
jgi:transcriptional regulator with XRE-family HTH domain